MSNKVHVNISGISIVISTEEEESYVQRIADAIDRDMQMLLENSKASVTSAALLCAIDYMDRFQKANRSASNMRTQIKGYLSDAADAKLQYDEERKKNQIMSAEMEELKRSFERRAKEESNARNLVDEKERENLLLQLKALNDRLVSQNEYIAKQDREISRLRNIETEQVERIGLQSGRISELEDIISRSESVINELKNRLMMRPEHRSERKSSVISDEYSSVREEEEQSSLFEEIPPATSNFKGHINEDYPEEEMPDLGWTRDI
ncbi:MAG: cell division protein ZapA [Ruminococcaceae bacterium]|nr:cell division protein ZapA [Oscillospiraceae bacterium]